MYLFFQLKKLRSSLEKAVCSVVLLIIKGAQLPKRLHMETYLIRKHYYILDYKQSLNIHPKRKPMMPQEIFFNVSVEIYYLHLASKLTIPQWNYSKDRIQKWVFNLHLRMIMNGIKKTYIYIYWCSVTTAFKMLESLTFVLDPKDKCTLHHSILVCPKWIPNEYQKFCRNLLPQFCLEFFHGCM